MNLNKIRMKILTSIKKMDILSLAILATITLVTRLALFINLENLYYVDCYDYLSKAILISEGKVVQFSRGYPFFSILGVIVKLTNGLVDPITSAKLFMILCNIALIFIIYFLSRHFFNTILAFFTALFVSFETNLILYSLVPYLEIFAYLTGFCSLYILISRFSKLDAKSILASLFLCAVSIFTRFEMLAVFLMPLAILLLINSIMYKKNRKVITLFFIVLGGVIFLFYPYFSSYYFGVTRFTPIERLILSLRWDILTSAFNSIFSISSSQLLNTLFKLICLFGVFYMLFTKIISPLIHRLGHHKSKSSFSKRLVSYFDDKARLTAISLSVSFVILLIITIVYYSVSYNIIDGKLIITSKQISSRNLIGPQLYLSWLFIYSLSRILKIPTAFKTIDTRTLILKTKIGNFTLNIRRLYAFFLVILLILWIPNMWMSGFSNSKMANQTMGLYRKTSQWLATNLKGNDVAIVPVEVVFHILDCKLRNKTVPYKLFWDKAGVTIRADNTLEEYYKVREQLVRFIMENKSVKYVVVDWMDGYCRPIFSLNVADELTFLLQEAHEEAIIRPHEWVPRIRVYKIARNWETVFYYNFSVPPEKYNFRVFGNCTGNYSNDSEGLSLHLYKAEKGSVAIFYLPLPSPIDIAGNKTIAILAKLNMTCNNSEVELDMYFDKNRDGVFSGYDIDYIKTVVSSFEQLQQSSMDGLTLIKQVNHLSDPIVQIAIRLRVNEDVKEASLVIHKLSILTPN